MQPNDLPLVCLPLDLPPAAVVELLAFLHALADALERHYGAALERHDDAIGGAQRGIAADEPPF